jgi:hypothetical protein
MTRSFLPRRQAPWLAACLMLAAGIATADDLPRFFVPGHEQAMKSLEDLHALHAPQAFSACTLWDGWLPHSTLWTGPGPRQRYRAALLARPIDAEGYVAMQQHRGLGQSDGWPFPTWQQSGGTGFHFSKHDEVFAIQMFNLEPLASTDGWEIDGATVAGIDPVRGLMLKATGDVVTITTPPFRCRRSRGRPSRGSSTGRPRGRRSGGSSFPGSRLKTACATPTCRSTASPRMPESLPAIGSRSTTRSAPKSTSSR